jgi:predicted metal-dependent hydrolase
MGDGTGANRPEVVVVRSRRRRRTAEVRRVEDRLEVRVPWGLGPNVERELVDRLVARALAPRSTHRGDAALALRARRLSERYFDGRARPTSVRYVDDMASRWGSATPATGEIRLSRRLQAMPAWVEDYVLVHELCHLLVPGHGPAFWRLVGRYPRSERARGYLLAMGHR